MSNIMQERYAPVRLDANASFTFPQGSPSSLAGFLCVTSGTITVTRENGLVVINAFPVTGGVYHPMPFHIGHNAVVTLAGGASGTLGVS